MRFKMHPYNHANHMMQIDSFIRSVVTSDLSLHSIQNEIARLIPHLHINLFADLQYSAAIMIYVEGVQQIKQLGILDVSQLNEYCLSCFKGYVLSQQSRITQEDRRFRLQEQKNHCRLEQYLGQLLNHYARLLFIRIDFAIKQEYQHEIGIRQFRDWISVMTNRYSNQDGCFSGLQGYTWAIEQGVDKGFHCHTLLIYDGSKHQKDFGVALQVVEYWQQLTRDKGYCFISNKPEYKRQFELRGTLGIGMIHRNNPMEVSNAINVAGYLVNPEKDQQNLRLRVTKMRTFGTGTFNNSKRRFANRIRLT